MNAETFLLHITHITLDEDTTRQFKAGVKN